MSTETTTEWGGGPMPAAKPAPLTRQEMFTRAYLGLKGQGFQRCGVIEQPPEWVGDGIPPTFRCKYNGANDTHCAIGHTIAVPADKYEGQGAAEVLMKLFPALRYPSSDNILSFADNLQMAHDESETPDAMKQALKEFAGKHGVEIPDESVPATALNPDLGAYALSV